MQEVAEEIIKYIVDIDAVQGIRLRETRQICKLNLILKRNT